MEKRCTDLTEHTTARSIRTMNSKLLPGYYNLTNFEDQKDKAQMPLTLNRHMRIASIEQQYKDDQTLWYGIVGQYLTFTLASRGRITLERSIG